MPVGLGVRVRHSRRCSTDPCGCDPTFEAWVYDAAKGRKIRKSFASVGDARIWRLERLRSMYDAAPRSGRLDTGYAQLRRTIAEIDAARTELPRRRSAEVRGVIDALYVAEDRLLEVLRGV